MQTCGDHQSVQAEGIDLSCVEVNGAIPTEREAVHVGGLALGPEHVAAWVDDHAPAVHQ